MDLFSSQTSVLWITLGLAIASLSIAIAAAILSSTLAVGKFRPASTSLSYVSSRRSESGGADNWPSIVFDRGVEPNSLNSMPFFTTAASPVPLYGIKTILCQQNDGLGGPFGLAFEIETTGVYNMMIEASFSVINDDGITNEFNNGIAVRNFGSGAFPGTTLITSCSTTKNIDNENLNRGDAQTCAAVVSLAAGDKLEMVVVAYSHEDDFSAYTFNVVSATFALAQIA